MRTRLQHPLVVTGLVWIGLLVPIVGLTLVPRWHVREVTIGSPGEDFQPGSWSPDGKRFIFSRIDQFIVVRVADGVVVRTGYGAFPTWIDNDTIDAEYGSLPGGFTRIHQTNIRNGRIDTDLPVGLSIGRLVGRGALDLAGPRNDRGITTVVFDPVTGREIAAIREMLPIAWAHAGVLIGKAAGPAPLASGWPPGSLVAWSAPHGARPIGAGLVESRDAVSPSPDGQAIVCACTRAGPNQPPDGMYRIPVDGSPATMLAPFIRGTINAQFGASWLEDGSVVFLDGAGLHRIAPNGTDTAIAIADPEDLPAERYVGRAYRLGDMIVLASQRGSTETGEARVTLRGLDGSVQFRQTFPSWNGAGLILDPVRPQALVITDPQSPNGRPQRFFILDRG